MPESACLPKLTVLLLCWNHSAYLKDCIDSLAAQTRSHFEVIFLDNASTDGSAELAEKLFSTTALRYRVVRNMSSAGIAANLNTLLSYAKTELVSVLSTDDWYSPNYVECVCAKAETNLQSALFVPNGYSVYENGRSIPSCVPAYDEANVSLQILFEPDQFFWVGLCYRREALVGVNGWDAQQPIEDADLLYRLTKVFPITQLADHLVYYRRSSTSISLNPVFMAKGRLAFYTKHRADFGNRWNRLVAEVLRSGAAVAIDQGNYGGALKLLLTTLTYKPLMWSTWRTAFYLVRKVAGFGSRAVVPVTSGNSP